ncbi:MAG TPA: hypothetical protein DD429_04410, partial [Clostridiaceae bacterium]|nr:hypothetical protein [Clostridiaceae bacterium]
MNFMKDNRELLEKAPSGMYAVAKIEDSIKDEAQPGVIFALRQLKGVEQSKEQNPLFPYYLVYV